MGLSDPQTSTDEKAAAEPALTLQGVGKVSLEVLLGSPFARALVSILSLKRRGLVDSHHLLCLGITHSNYERGRRYPIS
jgi:hypothetical protein